MLLQIRDFIQRAQVVSTQQLAREFQLDEEALQPMLDFWVNRSVIRPCSVEVACQGGCFRCKIGGPVFYQCAFR